MAQSKMLSASSSSAALCASLLNTSGAAPGGPCSDPTADSKPASTRISGWSPAGLGHPPVAFHPIKVIVKIKAYNITHGHLYSFILTCSRHARRTVAMTPMFLCVCPLFVHCTRIVSAAFRVRVNTQYALEHMNQRQDAAYT